MLGLYAKRAILSSLYIRISIPIVAPRLLNLVRYVDDLLKPGYMVGPGRCKNTIAAGYNASSGRPIGTTATAGYSVNLSGG